MKYICLGYMNQDTWAKMSEAERAAFDHECQAYDEVLRQSGHILGGEDLGRAADAASLHWDNGKVSVTDGPFIETKEQLGGLLIIEARDLNDAIQLMSKHPSIRMGGSWEVRPGNS